MTVAAGAMAMAQPARRQGMAMMPSGELPMPLLGAELILDQVETGVVVTDRQGNLTYANAFAVTLFGFPDTAAHLVGRPLLSLGFEADNVRRAQTWAARSCAAGRGRAHSRARGSTDPGSSSARRPPRCAIHRARSPE